MIWGLNRTRMLMTMIEQHISDGRMLKLINSFLKQGILEGVKEWEPERGAPQGGLSAHYAQISISTLWITSWKKADLKWFDTRMMQSFSVKAVKRRSKPFNYYRNG